MVEAEEGSGAGIGAGGAPAGEVGRGATKGGQTVSCSRGKMGQGGRAGMEHVAASLQSQFCF